MTPAHFAARLATPGQHALPVLVEIERAGLDRRPIVRAALAMVDERNRAIRELERLLAGRRGR